MIVQWTLNVEGFGKIENASVRISPFMIFAGDNNSGKSYMMTLLWGILMIEEFIQELTDDIFETDAYKKCVDWLENHKNEQKIVLDQNSINLFFDLINVVLDINKSYLIKAVFNADIPIRKIRITDLEYSVPVTLIQTNNEDEYFYTNYSINSKEYYLKTPSFTAKELFYLIIEFLCFRLFLGYKSASFPKATYLPASRTGFMLTYKALASRSVRHAFLYGHDERSRFGNLTAPVSHFLSDLVSMNINSKGRFIEVAEFLENHILQGTIQKDQSPVPNFLFKPKDAEHELSLHVTSSLVAELSPIVLYLKSNERLNTMIIEEPEAHLHLEMQRHIARAMVRLVNLGLPVWITTHSDTLVQQINNLIKLNNNTHRQELSEQYGYEEQDFLDSEKVSVYQFITQPERSIVQVQPLTSSGFSFPTFTESITKLTKETIDFMENDTDEEDD